MARLPSSVRSRHHYDIALRFLFTPEHQAFGLGWSTLCDQQQIARARTDHCGVDWSALLDAGVSLEAGGAVSFGQEVVAVAKERSAPKLILLPRSPAPQVPGEMRLPDAPTYDSDILDWDTSYIALALSFPAPPEVVPEMLVELSCGYAKGTFHAGAVWAVQPGELYKFAKPITVPKRQSLAIFARPIGRVPPAVTMVLGGMFSSDIL